MDKCIGEKNRRDCLSLILNKIVSKPEREIIKINDLYTDSECERCILSTLTFLNVLGVIELTESTLKIKSLTAKYFISSYINYFSNDLKLFTNWEEQKGKLPELKENNMFFGPNFLYYMEKRRVETCSNSLPIRYGDVSRVIIKTKYKGKYCYLMQFDPKTHQYKTIGGNKELFDRDNVETLKREISEELPKSKLTYNENYKLKLMCNSKERIISSVFGAYTEYDLHFYHAYEINGDELILAQNDRWITIDEIKKRRADDGVEVFHMSQEVISEMESLQSSIKLKKSNVFIEFILGKNKVITLICVILTTIVSILGFIKLF